MEVFDTFLQKLTYFFKLYGHTYVHPGWQLDETLRVWVSQVREGTYPITEEERNKLRELNFEFDTRRAYWMNMYYWLGMYIEKYGSESIPYNEPALQPLRFWLNNQKMNFKKGKLNPNDAELLRTLGVKLTMGPKDKLQNGLWEKRFKQLKDFFDSHGHIKVPEKGEHNSLFTWLITQRQQGKKLPQERIDKLNSLGFLWKSDKKRIKQDAWNQKFEALQAFIAKYGHMKVPIHQNQPYYSLYKWIDTQRQKEHLLSEFRRKKLISIGFKFSEDIQEDRNRQWDEMYEQLKAFYKEHGHCNVPKTEANLKLSVWVKNQTLRKEKLQKKQREKLFRLGFEFKTPRMKTKYQIWDERYQELLRFYTRFGHIRVPYQWKENPGLAAWISYQRRKPMEDFTLDQQMKLDKVGFSNYTELEKVV